MRARVHVDNCAACHRPDGPGYERVFPGVADNSVVEAPNSASLISIVLTGYRTPRTPKTPAQLSMPAFAWRLDDQEVADVVDFIRSSWGNSAPMTSTADVAAYRKALVPGHLARVAMNRRIRDAASPFRARTLVVLASFSLAGCSRGGAPSFDLFGAFFPAWLLCGIVGIAGAIVARVAFLSSGVVKGLPYQLAVCTAIGVSIALLFWLVGFGH